MRLPGDQQTLSLLQEVERAWREALSHVECDDPEAAFAEVARASDALAEITHSPREPLGDPAVAVACAEVVRRLLSLQPELIRRCREGMMRLERAMADIHRGEQALRAYTPFPRFEQRGFDASL